MGHGMYHCPHPRCILGDMYPPQRPPQTIQFDVPQQPLTILRRPPPPPQPMAVVPPVPEQSKEQGVNIIKLEEPEELNVMPAIKRTRAQERDEEMKSDTSDEPKKGKKKAKEDEAKSSKKKKSRRPRRVIGIDDFPLGKNLEPYDMVEDLKLQRPNITWPQLMHLSSSIHRQWPKLASTKIPKKKKEKVVKSIKSNTPKDIKPIVDAYIKGKRVPNIYVGGGAQMCVITERTMHRLGLGITETSDCHAKLENNSKVKCLGIIKDVHITVLDVSAKVDFYVMPSKGEGYPLILGRPWLMKVNADQKWGSDKITQFEVMLGAIKFKEPLFQGQETMEDILYFLEIGECPKHLEKVQQHCLVRKALSYQLIGEHLYHKGKDLVLRRVPLVKEIEKILMACKACQQAGDRKLSYGPRFPIFAYGPFEKWGIDAIGPLPRTSTGKQYILTATDYMTRWAEAASVAHITTTDVSKFVLDYICSRLGTPLEILSDRGLGFMADWDKHLTAALWAYRTSFKVSTQFTPYHLVYGQEALLPIEVEVGSLRVLAKDTTSSKEKLEQRILDLQ
ncbi:hypothetical protein L7F22_059059 [Adiantum nelumboides]|nr:hypothetical protein [Adiantum nelumboides]